MVGENASLVGRATRSVVAAALILLIGLILFALGSVLARRVGGDPLAALNAASDSARARPAPEFELTLFDGSSLRLADLRGRGVVINFWSSWCVPCQREMPLLAQMAREYDPQRVTFVGVALWDAKSDAVGFFTRYGASYPSGLDERGTIAIDFGVGGLPETFFVRPDGAMSRRWIGELRELELRRFVDELRT